MIRRNALQLILAFIVITLVAFCFYLNQKIDNVVVVDVIKVFNEFKMKKQLEDKVSIELDRYSIQIDSLTSLLEMSNKRQDDTKGEIIANEIYNLRSTAQRAYDISNKNINEQVWNRLNPMIKDFAKEGGYRIVIGANGMGTVLYNIEGVDRTEELIKFINNRYETGN